MGKVIWTVWTNTYVNYLGDVHFSKGYLTKNAALQGKRRTDVQYLGDPFKIDLKK